jgi:hypothetical protein
MPIPKLVVTAALMVAQMAIGASRKIEGPRLDELNVTGSEYGTPLPRFWGIRRFEVPIMWAEKLREKKKESKTKGGKYSEYRYYGTWAVAICDHEIEAVSRIWMDRRLVYQKVAAGPTSIAYILGLDNSGVTPVLEGGFLGDQKLTVGKHMRVYYGTDTQEPDPRMEAWCEDRYGADSCPAYRGIAYIVFENIPLEKFGNRIPQISVEAISDKSDAFIYEDRLDDGADWNVPVVSKSAERLLIGQPSDFQMWDTATRSKLVEGALPSDGVMSFALGWAMDSEGNIHTTGYMTPATFPQKYMFSWSSDGTSGPAAVPLQDTDGNWYPFADTTCLITAEGDLLCLDVSSGSTFATMEPFDVAPHVYFPVDLTGTGWATMAFCADTDGNAWAIGLDGTEVTFYNITQSDFFVVDLAQALSTFNTLWGAVHYKDNDVDHFLLVIAGEGWLIDRNTGLITDGPFLVEGSDVHEVMKAYPPGSSSIFLSNGTSNLFEYSTKTGAQINNFAAASWAAGVTSNGIYDPVNHAWISFSATLGGGGNPGLRWYYLGRVASDGVPLSDIVDDVAGWCGLTGHDASDLDQIVQGYSVTQGSGKDMIAPLLEVHDSIARPHDFSVQFLKRGDAPSGTLLTEDFVREGDEARYTVSITQDTDLPRGITLSFADKGKDQQTNAVETQRHLTSVDSVREQSIDMTTYVSSPDEAQKLADRYFRRLYIARETINNGLTAQELALEPGDVRNLDLDGIVRTAMCRKVTLSGGALQVEWERDFPGLATLGSGTGAEMDGRDEDVIYIASPSKGFVLDIPLVTDDDNNLNPLLYYGAGKYISTGNWPGAVVYEGDPDGEEYSDWNAVESSQGATWGYATTVLGDANPNLWDRGSTVNIGVKGGTLLNATEAAIDADPTVNMAYFGGELLNFTTAFLESDGTYTLSGFKRGRRGTEWTCSTHGVGDEFVMVEDLLNEGVGLSEVGTVEHFKVASFGRDPSSAPPIDFTFTGASLKPYAPAVQSVTKDAATGDIVVDFDRRTRIGGNWNGSVIPLGEASEAYEMDVLDGSDVARTLTATTSSFTYTAAMQTTDFGAPIAANDLDAELFQISATVGRGFATAV